jgi:carboxynorspermidine decarboxylase
MDTNRIQRIIAKVDTPCFVVDLELLNNNLKILDLVQKKAGCKILLALKGFAMFSAFPLINKYLNGVCASGLNEAKLGFEEFKKEVHTFSPGFTEKEFPEIIRYSDHIIFNSISQLEQFKPFIKKNPKIKFGLRINPEKSVAGIKFGVYDPCSKNSRLGITLNNLEGKDIAGVSGLHFHALCEQDADALEQVLSEFDKKFSKYIKMISWVNFGGGHHITREDYDTEKLCRLIINFKKRYPNIKEVYLEPGEAVALNTGILVTTVVDIVKNEKPIAILDTSVECHLPDVLITRHEPQPYIPEVIGAAEPNKYQYTYSLAGVSCAAGDVIGEYSFKNPLTIGEKIIFLDAAHYSMVKTNTFNGIGLPSIYTFDPKKDKLNLIRKFGYEDYKTRLS